jgi:hypothetical protein
MTELYALRYDLFTMLALGVTSADEEQWEPIAQRYIPGLCVDRRSDRSSLPIPQYG